MFALRYILIFAILGILSACSYSINMVHTKGQATDIIDEDQKSSAEAQITPKV